MDICLSLEFLRLTDVESERESVNWQLNVDSPLDASEARGKAGQVGKEAVLAGMKTALGRDHSSDSRR